MCSSCLTTASHTTTSCTLSSNSSSRASRVSHSAAASVRPRSRPRRRQEDAEMASERAKAMRAARRTAAFAKFRMVELNLVPLVDTFVSIVFFALTAATVGELAPILSGVTLPEASVGIPAHQEVTLGVASNPAQIVFNGTPLMSVQEAASATSNLPTEPLVIPALYTRLKASVDSIRQTSNL